MHLGKNKSLIPSSDVKVSQEAEYGVMRYLLILVRDRPAVAISMLGKGRPGLPQFFLEVILIKD
jgi:hypothetical protein